MTHNFDFFTDLEYLRTVPIYSNWLRIPIILTLVIPPIFIMKEAWGFSDKKPLKAAKLGFLNITGATVLVGFFFDFLKDHKEQTTEEQKMKLIRDDTIENGQGIMAYFYSIEDGPQFALQMINSMLIGKSWSWVMVISPLLSISGLMTKAHALPTAWRMAAFIQRAQADQLTDSPEH